MRNDPDVRRCYVCKDTFPATVEHFPRDKNRNLGIGYQCRPCAKKASKLRAKPRPMRWAQMTPEQKKKRKDVQTKYNSGGGWRAMRVGAYRLADKKKGLACDLDAKWFAENIQNKRCFYCHRANVRIGCDRIDNSIGHLKSNVVPCCGDCNRARGDMFTHEEMIELGAAIRKIHARRSRLQNASNLSSPCIAHPNGSPDLQTP